MISFLAISIWTIESINQLIYRRCLGFRVCRTSVIKKKIGTWSKKQWIRKIKNREVFEGQPGVFRIRNNLTKIYIEKKLRSDPVAAFSAVAVSFLVFPLSFADSTARKRMFVSINVGLQQVGLQHAGILSVLYGGPKRTCHIFFLSRDKWETCWVALYRLSRTLFPWTRRQWLQQLESSFAV